MLLILISLLTGILGMLLGGVLGGEGPAYIFGILGVLSPGLFTLQKIHEKLEELEKKVK